MSIRPILIMILLLSGCATDSALRAGPADPAVAALNVATPGAPYRESWSGSGENRIHYVVAGQGPPIVFVHGFPSFWYAWRPQLEAFRACRTVIAIDAPGANLSGRPAAQERYRIDRLARRLDSFLAEVSPREKVTLVGHDWGGALAWSYAQWKPDRLDRLVVFSAPSFNLLLEMAASDPEQRARSAYMERFRALDLASVTARGIDETLWRTAYAEMVERNVLSAGESALFRAALTPAAVDAGMAWYRANVPPLDAIDPDRDGWPARPASTTVPTLLVQGERDRIFIPQMAERARAHAADLTTVMLPGVAHWTPFEDPAAANAALGRFLGLPGGRCPGAK